MSDAVESVYVDSERAQSIQELIDALEELKSCIPENCIDGSKLNTYLYGDGTLKFFCEYKKGRGEK